MAKKKSVAAEACCYEKSNCLSWGIVLLLIGILYLGQDLACWNFW